MKRDSTPSAAPKPPRQPAKVRENAPTYLRDVARLQKKHPKLPEYLRNTLNAIAADPEATDPIPGFAHRVWKDRVRDGTKGKKGAMRLVYEWSRQQNLVTPLLLFPKNEQADVVAAEIRRARVGTAASSSSSEGTNWNRPVKRLTTKSWPAA